MNSEIADLLRDLAEQLKTSAEYLWPLLVEQTRIDWLAGMILSSVLFIVSAGIAMAACYLSVKQDDTSYDPLIAIFCGASLFCFLCVCYHILTISSYLVPEAATIKDLLELM